MSCIQGIQTLRLVGGVAVETSNEATPTKSNSVTSLIIGTTFSVQPVTCLSRFTPFCRDLNGNYAHV